MLVEGTYQSFLRGCLGRLLLIPGALFLSGFVGAQIPESTPTLSPLIESIFPRGGRQGSEFDIVIRGKYLDAASEIRLSGGDVRCEILTATHSRVKAHVRISESAAAGRRDLRLITPRGSFVQAFQVGALPEQRETEPNDDWSTAPAVEMPIVINGRVGAKDYDHFRFQAQADQTLVFDLNSSRNGTRFDGMLSILDAKGDEIAAQDDYYFDKDPHLDHRFEEAGDYVVRVNGFGERGSRSSEYRLMMGELPSLSHVFPAGGQRGKPVEFIVSGQNLDDVDGVWLGAGQVRGRVLERERGRLKVGMELPLDLAPGYYPLRVAVANTEMPNPLVFAVSETREIVLSGDKLDTPMSLDLPVVVNGCLCKPRQKDEFWLDVEAGEQITFDAEGMRLGNFLDPSIVVYDASGAVVAYMDETAPNGFDKEPPQLDFHLVHRFEHGGRYRVEMRDAGLRGREDLIYRLSVSRGPPQFQLMILTNQLTIMPGQPARVPVRVKRLAGWDTPVKVWAENLPVGVKSKPVIAEPVNTGFRGTFGEDFFFDGTNVEVPLEAAEGTPRGIHAIQVRARGTMNGETLERTATVFYPWQQTGFLRGPTQEQECLLTVARVPLFDVTGPPSLSILRGEAVEVPLRVRWISGEKEPQSLQVEPLHVPAGIVLERFEVNSDGEKVAVWIRLQEQVQDLEDKRVSLVVSLQRGNEVFRKAVPDIEVKLKKKKAQESGS